MIDDRPMARGPLGTALPADDDDDDALSDRGSRPISEIEVIMELRQTYWRNGYRPVAIYSRQKRPRGDGWRADALQDPPLWAARWPEDNALSTGIATGRLAGIDVDVLIQEIVDRIVFDIEHAIGVTPLLRIGRAPKTLLGFRCEHPFRKLATDVFIMPDGTEAKVEILADGQQFVADGIHPDTGLPYLWPAGSPQTVALGQVPAITLEQAQAVVARARDLLLANGGVPKKPPPRERNPHDAAAGDSFFAKVNEAALRNLAAWVKTLFPRATYQAGTGAWRVAPKDRGRPDLDEDISFHPDGIQDFGMEHGLTPIDIVLGYGNAHDASHAAVWLCERIGLDPAQLGWRNSGETAEPGTEARNKQQRPEPGDQPKRILSGADFIARHVPPVWLIDGIVQRSRLYACTSLTGHGKTAVWLVNACMIHAGRMIGQLNVFQGNVLFLAGENPADLEARMIGMARTFKLPSSQLPYVLPGSFPLTEEEADALKRDIAGLGIPLALIVGDTASSFFPGDDENSNTQAGAYARTLRSFTECDGHPAVVVLSHPVKNASRSNLLPRGGSAFLNELDGNLALWSDSPGEVTELHWCGKIRGPDFSPFGYRLRPVPTGLTDERDRPEMTIVAEPMSEEAVADHAKQTLANEDVVLRALRDHSEWSWAQIAREAGWVDDDDKPERWRVQRALQSLADDKLIDRRRKGERWRLTDKGEKAINKDNP